MSRSGYSDDYDDEHLNLYRANVDRAFLGKRGQAFLKAMLDALDAMPEKRLISEVMQSDGEVCAIGSVGRARGIDMADLDPDNYEEWDFAGAVAHKFNIANPMAAEIMYMNDGGFWIREETPEQRYVRMRAWVESHIIKEEANAAS